MSGEIPQQTEPLNASIDHREDLTDGLAIIRVRPDESPVPEFTPGQFCTLGLEKLDENGCPLVVHGKPKRVRRAYSIASSADERRYIEIYLTRIEGGQLTPRVFALDVGRRVFLDPRIKGTFTLEHVPTNANIIMIATGTGLAPYVSMLKTYLRRGEQRWKRCVVVHGARQAAELGYREELEHLAAKHESVVYIPTVSREPDGSPWQGLRGRVQTAMKHHAFESIAGFPLSPEHCQILLCGNPVMITSIEGLLHEQGFLTHSRQQAGQIHFERYW